MSRIAYVDGAYAPIAAARLAVEDRGLQFGDSVYEVWPVLGGRLIDADGHYVRLERSLKELSITLPLGWPALSAVLREVMRRNRVRERGLVYLQITRGAAPRDHVIPTGITPTLIVTAKSLDGASAKRRFEQGIAVSTQPDLRWGRCDIKTTNLLPNVMAKTAARRAGCFEAWLVDADGAVTEGASTTAWIVSREGALLTRALSHQILPGVSRASVLDLAQKLQIKVEERAFSVTEAYAAREAFQTSASALVAPVVSIDGHTIGDGRPGPMAQRLHAAYMDGIFAAQTNV